MFHIGLWSVGKSGSLGFALGWFLRGSKTQCAACAVALKLFSKNVGGQKNKKYSALACVVGKLSVQVVKIVHCQYLFYSPFNCLKTL